MISKREVKRDSKRMVMIRVFEILKLTETDLELKAVEQLDLTKEGEELWRSKRDAVYSYKRKTEEE